MMISQVARPAWLVPAAAALAALTLGAAAAFAPFNALILVALALIVPAALWFLGDTRRALFALLAVLAVLPRFASPVSIGFKPTTLDLALVMLLIAAARDIRAGPGAAAAQTPSALRLPVLLLATVALATFIVGSANGALTSLVIRRFGELVLSLLMILVLTRVLRDLPMQERFVRFTLLLAGLSALIGIALVVIPDETAIRLLSSLRVFDYPTGPGVLRFIRDDPALSQRATGLWIDPNAFGGYLLLACALCLPQLFAPKPVLPRPLVLAAIGVMALCLVLTVSRAAMLGLTLAAGVMAALRYRRLFALGAAAIVLILVLPQTRALVAHFIDGFQGNDLATQMRFGEYKDAFRLIERYPLLGVGFTGSPDVDLYVGVSSMYLLIMQQMGLLGILGFATLMIALFAGAWRAWPALRADDRRSAVFLGAHCAVIGALFSGFFDHYFFNIDFHNAVMWLCAILALAAASQGPGPRQAARTIG